MSETALIQMLPNLGVGVAAIVVLYLCFKIAIQSINEKDRAFREYVQEHNHKSIEVMCECRDAIRESAEKIKSNTKVQEKILLNLLRDKDDNK